MNEAPSPESRLVRARRQFLGAMFLLVLTAIVLPWVMDAVPPETLREPEIRIVQGDKVTVIPPRQAGPTAEAPSEAVPETPPSDAVQTPSAALAAKSDASADASPPSKAPEPAATASAQKPTPSPGGAASAEAPKGAAVPPTSEPPKTTAIPPGLRFDAKRVGERARATAALKGVASPDRPLTRYWLVQVAALRDAELAAKEAQRYRQSGLTAYVLEADGQGWYRVRIGPYVSENEAREAVQLVRERFKAQAHLVAVNVP